MNEVLTAAAIMIGVAGFFGVVLSVANRYLRVEEDPRIPEIMDVLPSANCGGCGFAGCADFAKAVVEERIACDGRPVGSYCSTVRDFR